MSTLILGSRGLAGSALVRELTKQRRPFLSPNSRELNLLIKEEVERYLHANKVETIFFLAARVGGVGANLERPLDYLNDNLQMELNTLNCAIKKRIPRLFFISSSCVYPEFGSIPYSEDSVMSGKLSKSIQPYALAKLVGMELVDIAVQKYGLSWVTVIPSNLYGIGDNFLTNESHVIASIMRKIWESKKNDKSTVSIWGNPLNARDFLFADDLAHCLLFLEKVYFEESPINVSPGYGTSIRNLCGILAKVMAYSGVFEWDENQPSGTHSKVLDNKKLVKLGFKNFTELGQGIASMYAWLQDESLNRFESVRWHE